MLFCYSDAHHGAIIICHFTFFSQQNKRQEKQNDLSLSLRFIYVKLSNKNGTNNGEWV